jgi:cytidine deaminase
MTKDELVKAAKAAMQNAYAPYSKFLVGAAVLCGDGSVFTGCNIENGSYPACICAERVALCSAYAAGKRNFSAIAIISSSKNYCMPCGVCRQVIAEIAPEITVLCAKNSGEYKEYSISELLPHSFEL